MKIFFFERDGSLIQVGFKANGKRYIGALWSQAGRFFVSSGAAIAGNLRRYDFTDSQSAAAAYFLALRKDSPDYFSVEYQEGI